MKKSELKKLIEEVVGENWDEKFKSDWGDTPQEVLGQVMSSLERDVEWPLTDIMDYKEVNKLLWPIRDAINKQLKKYEKI